MTRSGGTPHVTRRRRFGALGLLGCRLRDGAYCSGGCVVVVDDGPVEGPVDGPVDGFVGAVPGWNRLPGPKPLPGVVPGPKRGGPLKPRPSLPLFPLSGSVGAVEVRAHEPTSRPSGPERSPLALTRPHEPHVAVAAVGPPTDAEARAEEQQHHDAREHAAEPPGPARSVAGVVAGRGDRRRRCHRRRHRRGRGMAPASAGTAAVAATGAVTSAGEGSAGVAAIGSTAAGSTASGVPVPVSVPVPALAASAASAPPVSSLIAHPPHEAPRVTAC